MKKTAREDGGDIEPETILLEATISTRMKEALTRLGRVTGLVPRIFAVRTRLAALGPENAVAALEAALHGSDRDLLLACGLALLDADVGPLQRIAAGRAPRTALFLADAPPHRTLALHGRLPDVGMIEGRSCAVPLFQRDREPVYEEADTGEELPHWSWSWAPVRWETHHLRIRTNQELYRYHRRAFVRRAVLHPSADFLRRFVRGPDATPKDIHAIAVRRPTTEAIVRVLVDHAPTIANPTIRVALACNPFTPTRIALLLVPSCQGYARTIARSNVHPLVRALAARI